VVKVSAKIAAVSAQAPAAVGLSTAVALAPKDILKYPEQVHQDEVVTTYAASAGTQEGAYTIAAVGERPTAFAPTTSPEEIMNSNKSADVAPWRTDLMTRIKERFKALDMELDAKAAARREQTVQVERKNVEKQAELQNEVVKTADIEKEKGNQTLTVEAVTSKPELDYRRQKTEQTHEVREQAEISAELRARFDVAGQEPDVAKLAVQLPVQDVSEPALNCVERIQQQHEQHEGDASEQAVHAGSMPEEVTELGYLEWQQSVLDCVG